MSEKNDFLQEKSFIQIQMNALGNLKNNFLVCMKFLQYSNGIYFEVSESILMKFWNFHT